MPYQPIAWARQTVLGRQTQADGARLLNFYAVRAILPDEAKVPIIIYGTPGYRVYGRVPPQTFDQGGSDVTPDAGIYGLIENDSPVYGNKLYGISSEYQFFEFDPGDDYDPNRSSSTLLALSDTNIRNFTEEDSNRATEPIHMVTDGRRIMWIINQEVFMWDIDADAFVTVLAPTPDDASATLPDEEWVDCEWIDGYFILVSRGGQFFHSLLNSNQFDQLDTAFASAKPDEVIGVRAFQRRLYVFGSQTIEQWYNAGTTDFAFRRDNSYIADIGCASRATIQANEVGLFFLGSDKIVYGMYGSNVVRMSTESVEYDLNRADLPNCHAFSYTEEGHRFYSLTVPFQDGSDARNWTLDISTQLWAERSLTDVYAAATYRDRLILGKYDNENLFELSLDWGDENGANIRREAVTPILYANEQRALCHSFEVDIPQRDTPSELSLTLTGNASDGPSQFALQDTSNNLIPNVFGTGTITGVTLFSSGNISWISSGTGVFTTGVVAHITIEDSDGNLATISDVSAGPGTNVVIALGNSDIAALYRNLSDGEAFTITITFGGAAADNIRLEWLDDDDDDWKGGNLDSLPLDRRRYRWRQLGQFRSRNFQIIVDAKRRVDVLGAYVQTDVDVD